ncbi:hypothetical protein [Leptothermofonsia sp. ETS-13]|uniref:hypothetical protein n=1 Tax=Leptothermofonsia sp. ETS-13 TaxID=3035696 RepID=UPI003BA0766F
MNRSLKTLVTLTCSSILLGSQTILFQQPARAQTFLGFVGCPAGTREGPINLVSNGNFNISPGVVNGPLLPGNPAGFTSTLPYRGDGVYPDDTPPLPIALGGLSIQTGTINYLGGVVVGQPFPGDPANGVLPSNTYLYSNPNASAATPLVPGSAFPPISPTSPIIWSQTLTGLAPNATYNFTAYFYNLLTDLAPPGAAPPVIRLLAGPPGGPDTAFVPSLSGQPVTTRQQWLRVQGLFSPNGLPSLELRIVDEANTIVGDDFGMTAVGFRECIPIIGVAKSAGTPVQNANGTFTIPYTVTVQNFAPNNPTFTVNNLQLTEDLRQTFANATINSVTNIQSPTLTVNPAFNGTTDFNLLAPGVNTLAGQTTTTVTFSVTITPGAGPSGSGPFNNQVTVTGGSQGGTPLTDLSVDGTNPDPNGDGNPDEGSPTTVTLVPGASTPRLGVAKSAGTPVQNANGTFTIPYTVIVQNLSPNDPALTVNNLQIMEDLRPTFANATINSVTNLQSPTLVVNSAFNGTTDFNLLGPGNSLPGQTSALVTFSVNITPGSGPSGSDPFANQVTANGVSPTGTPVTDQSVDGTNVDPNGDGIPNEGSPTQVVLPGTGIPTGNQRLRLVKRITGATRNGVPIPGINFNTFVNDPGSADDDAPGWAQFLPLGLVNIGANSPLRSGDEVTYTVYLLSDGDSPATAVTICDPVPATTTFVADSNQIQRPAASVSPGGAFFPPLAPLPTGNPCPSQTNVNGSVIYDVGDVPNTAGNNFGFVRFRVRID